MSGKTKYSKCCKCDKTCKFHGSSKQVYHDEPIIVIDKGNHIYCLDCFQKYIDNKHKPVYRG